jgi:hypothetical protein
MPLGFVCFGQWYGYLPHVGVGSAAHLGISICACLVDEFHHLFRCWRLIWWLCVVVPSFLGDRPVCGTLVWGPSENAT